MAMKRSSQPDLKMEENDPAAAPIVTKKNDMSAPPSDSAPENYILDSDFAFTSLYVSNFLYEQLLLRPDISNNGLSKSQAGKKMLQLSGLVVIDSNSYSL